MCSRRPSLPLVSGAVSEGRRKLKGRRADSNRRPRLISSHSSGIAGVSCWNRGALYPALCSSPEARTRGSASSAGCAGRRPRIQIRSTVRRRTSASFGCSQSSTRTTESLRKTLTWVCTNFDTKTGGPLKCARIGCSCLSQQSEFTMTATSPF
jgi:hypothetical protein